MAYEKRIKFPAARDSRIPGGGIWGNAIPGSGSQGPLFLFPGARRDNGYPYFCIVKSIRKNLWKQLKSK